MARITYRLSAAKVENVRKKGLHPDGDGLYLRITKTGTKKLDLSLLRARSAPRHGARSLSEVSLAKARESAAQCRQLRREGHDPIKARTVERRAQEIAAAQAATFKDCAEQLIASHEAGWRNAKHRQQWYNTLATYAYPVIGEIRVGQVDTDGVLRVLQQPVRIAGGKTASLWNARSETASRLRGRIEAVLSWAKAKGLREGENPAQWRGHMDQLLPKRSKVRRVRHHPALPYAELPAFMANLRGRSGIAPRALEFVVLTTARTGEALGARFDEIDFVRMVWTVPADRMKGDREHRVPLSARAIAIVKEMREVRINEFVFPGMKQGRPLSNMAFLMLLRELRPGITTHGFRSSFKDWANEKTSFPDFVSEMALAHISSDKVRAAYARSDLFDLRRKLMDAWGDFCMHTAKVVQLAPIRSPSGISGKSGNSAVGI